MSTSGTSGAHKRVWLISCDESGVDGAPYYGFGSLWMPWERRGDIFRHLNVLREKHRYTREMKWCKAHNPRYEAFHMDVVDLFFARPWLSFHCMVVRKALVDRTLHGGDLDLARRKHFTKLLTNKMATFCRMHPGEDVAFRVYVDPIASRYNKADEVVEKVSNAVLAQEVRRERLVDSVVTRDSKGTPTIQLCDLLLGSLLDAWLGRATAPTKLRLQARIASHLGWSDLRADTYPPQRKFNVWYFHPERARPREIETRMVGSSLRAPSFPVQSQLPPPEGTAGANAMAHPLR